MYITFGKYIEETLQGKTGPYQSRKQVGYLHTPATDEDPAQLVKFEAAVPRDADPYLSDGTAYWIGPSQIKIDRYDRLEFSGYGSYVKLSDFADISSSLSTPAPKSLSDRAKATA